MTKVRQFLKFGGIFGLILSFFILFEISALILRIFGIRRIKVRNFFLRFWAKSVMSILGCEIILRGQAPKGRYLIVSNHLGYLDIVVFFTFLDVILISKSEVGNWPILGPIIKRVYTIMIDRKSRRDTSKVRESTEE